MPEPMILQERDLRWATTGDVPAMLALDEQCFEFSWAESDFTTALKDKQTVLRVALVHDQIVAFAVYESPNDGQTLRICRLAVDPAFQRRRIGTQLVNSIVSAMGRRTRIAVVVRENALDALVFLRALGFKFNRTISAFFEFGDGSQDNGIELVYSTVPFTPKRKPGKPRGPLTVSLKNRISKYFDKSGSPDDD